MFIEEEAGREYLYKMQSGELKVVRFLGGLRYVDRFGEPVRLEEIQYIIREV